MRSSNQVCYALAPNKTCILTALYSGGVWINLGPLLWTGGAQASIELSLDEIYDVAKAIGFNIEDLEDNSSSVPSMRTADASATKNNLSPRTVECEYTADPFAMMRWIYKAKFFVGKKPYPGI
jgi:hypothetical protein